MYKRWQLQLISARTLAVMSLLTGLRLLILAVLVAILTLLLGTALATLAGQIWVWLQSNQWLAMPIRYWFSYPWLAISADMSLYTAQSYINPVLNPFISLGAAPLIIDGATLLPVEGSYWATHLWFGSFADWLDGPRRWQGLHTVVSHLLRCPISLFLVLLALVVWRPLQGWLDQLELAIDRQRIERIKLREWARDGQH